MIWRGSLYCISIMNVIEVKRKYKVSLHASMVFQFQSICWINHELAAITTQ